MAAGEVRAVWDLGLVRNELCSCGEAFHDCPFWKLAIREARGATSCEHVDPLEFRPKVERARYMATGRAVGRRRLTASVDQPALERLYAAIARVSDSRVVVDSSKSPRYALLLSSFRSIDLRVVHLVRDSRAVAYSHQRERVRVPTPGQPRYMVTRQPLASSRRWIEKNALSEILRWHGVHYLRIRYEDFATTPKDTIRRLEAFLEEGITVPFVDDHKLELSPSHIPAGNYMRFRRGTTDIRLDDAWRQGMSAADKLAVSALTWPLLLRYGYPIAAN